MRPLSWEVANLDPARFKAAPQDNEIQDSPVCHRFNKAKVDPSHVATHPFTHRAARVSPEALERTPPTLWPNGSWSSTCEVDGVEEAEEAGMKEEEVFETLLAEP